MSIALTGQEKYDFQDLVCVRYALQFYQEDSAIFYVEPQGGEDAELHFLDKGKNVKCEIQVKGSEEPVSTIRLAECLGHFPAYGIENFLLKRIIEDNSSRAVFVMAGRGMDSVQKYIPKGRWDGSQHRTIRFTRDDAQIILDAVVEYTNSLPGTAQNIKRKKYVNEFVRGVDIDRVKTSLSRIIVLDNINSEKLIDECRTILRNSFFIPDDIFLDTVNNLVTVVKNCKSAQSDAIVNLISKLNERPVFSVMPLNYVTRGRESEWYERLKREHVILLSGIPRVGKSNTGKWLAAQYQSIGYRILVTQSIEDAERFLLDPVNSHRLVLLDDPLGGVHPVIKPNEKLVLLKNLLSHLRSDRKLIVAQGLERLLETVQEETLETAALRAHEWIDLSLLDNKFLVKYWSKLSESFSIPKYLFQIVNDFLQQDTAYIEPGCLSYLAAEHEKLPACNDIESILRFARKDANDLGSALGQEVGKNLLVGLAIATSHLENIHDDDLAWVLTGNLEKKYGYSSFLGTSITLGRGKTNDSYIFPVYEPAHVLTEIEKNSLGLLETRQIIEVDDNYCTTFSHPFYRAAAESLVRFSNRFEFSFAFGLLNNGIFCLSPKTARATARNINWIYSRIKKSKEKEAVIELAIAGLNSSYPSVRDICFDFLIDNLSTFDDKYKDDLISWVFKVNADNLESLEWHDEQPWYPMGENITLESSVLNIFRDFKGEDLIEEINNNNVVSISSEKAYNLLKTIERTPEKLTTIVMQRILSVSEGLIRALAARIWVSVNRHDDEEILERIFRDTHPAVAESVFKSSIRAWNTFTEKRQIFIFENLKKMASQPVLAQAIIGDLVVFEREHEMGVSPPWDVFSGLMPIALASLPLGVNINRARLFNVVKASTTKLSVNAIFSISESWIFWLEKINVKRQEDDFSLTVTDIILDIACEHSSIRLEIIKRLLKLQGTGAVSRVISDLVYYWVRLSDEEKKLISNLILSNRGDELWLKSAVLTSFTAPIELLCLILPSFNGQQLQPKDILDMDMPLLSSALKMYVGHPQPLWWYGTHHRENSVWPEVISIISHDFKHPLFTLAFNEVFDFGEPEQLIEIIDKADSNDAQKIFNIMIEKFIKGNPQHMPEVWFSLFSKVNDAAIHSEWIRKMVLHASSIFDDLSEACQFIPPGNIKEFYSYFKSDELIIKFISKIKEAFSSDIVYDDEISEFRNNFLAVLSEIFNSSPPNHYHICDYVMSCLVKIGFDKDDIRFVEVKRLELLDVKFADESNVSNEKLEGWYY